MAVLLVLITKRYSKINMHITLTIEEHSITRIVFVSFHIDVVVACFVATGCQKIQLMNLFVGPHHLPCMCFSWSVEGAGARVVRTRTIVL